MEERSVVETLQLGYRREGAEAVRTQGGGRRGERESRKGRAKEGRPKEC